MSVKFYLRSKTSEISSLDVIVRYKGDRFKFPSNISMDPKMWSQEKQRAKEYRYYDGVYINSALVKLESIYKDALNYFVSQMINPTKKEFEEKLKELIYGLNKEVNDNRGLFVPFVESTIEKLKGDRNPESIKSYNVLLGKLKEFEKDNKENLSFKDIDLDFYRSFQKWFYKQDYSANYFAKMIKIIKTFMTEANESGVTSFQGHKLKGFSKIEIESENIYLTVEELLRIHNLNINLLPIDKRETYLIVKNKFLIGAFTGLRISDFNRLDEININDNKIRIKTLKTLQNVVIPIHPVVKDILDSGFNLKSIVSAKAINDMIKDICCLAKINESVLINENIGGKNKQKVYKKWQLVSSHTARRSGATNMFKAGIPSISIMKITGHTTEKSFMKYIKISAEENADLLSRHEFFK